MLELGLYCRSRLLRWRMIALLALLVMTLGIADPPKSLDDLAGSVLLLGLAIIVLRIWDDLADRNHDRVAHPERVLVNARKLTPFVSTVAIGVLSIAGMLFSDSQRLAVFSILMIWLGLLYHAPRLRNLRRPVRTELVLLKYPVLVFLAGAAPSMRTWLVGLCLYAILVAHEWRDDRELRAAPLHELLLGAGSGAVIASLLIFGPGALV